MGERAQRCDGIVGPRVRSDIVSILLPRNSRLFSTKYRIEFLGPAVRRSTDHFCEFFTAAPIRRGFIFRALKTK